MLYEVITGESHPDAEYRGVAAFQFRRENRQGRVEGVEYRGYPHGFRMGMEDRAVKVQKHRDEAVGSIV